MQNESNTSNYNITKAALILGAIRHAADNGDEDCGDVHSSSNLLILIEAAATQASYLLLGYNLDEELIRKAPPVGIE